MRIQIRGERPEDVAVISSIIQEAFAAAEYADGTEHAVVRRLREQGALTVSLVAEINGEVVGHVAVSPVNLSDGSTHWFGLGPVAVLTAHQCQGIGTRLIDAAMQRLRDGGAAGCVVLGDPAYYGRFGFKSMPELTLPHFPAQYFQALPFTDSIPHAEVSYHSAFGIDQGVQIN